MWVVGETSTPETLPFKVEGGKHILTVLPCPPQSLWFHMCRIGPNLMLTARGLLGDFLKKLNPRNLNHLMSNDLEKIANFCVSFSCFWEEVEWGRGTLQSLLYTSFFLAVTAPQPNCDTFYLSSLAGDLGMYYNYPLLYVHVDLCGDVNWVFRFWNKVGFFFLFKSL